LGGETEIKLDNVRVLPGDIEKGWEGRGATREGNALGKINTEKRGKELLWDELKLPKKRLQYKKGGLFQNHRGQKVKTISSAGSTLQEKITREKHGKKKPARARQSRKGGKGPCRNIQLPGSEHLKSPSEHRQLGRGGVLT